MFRFTDLVENNTDDNFDSLRKRQKTTTTSEQDYKKSVLNSYDSPCVIYIIIRWFYDAPTKIVECVLLLQPFEINVFGVSSGKCFPNCADYRKAKKNE